MSVSNSNNENEILKFLDSHLVLRVLDFNLAKHGADNEILLKKTKQTLFKTLLFDQQIQFLNEHPSLVDSGEDYVAKISAVKETQSKNEEQAKQSIVGFLNLIENWRKNNNFDMSSSISKKIVSNICNIFY
jgi:hypothetical protein